MLTAEEERKLYADPEACAAWVEATLRMRIAELLGYEECSLTWVDGHTGSTSLYAEVDGRFKCAA